MISGGMACTNNPALADVMNKQYHLIRKCPALSSLKNFFKLFGYYLITKQVIFFLVTRIRGTFSGSHRKIESYRMNRFHYSAGICALSKMEFITALRKENSEFWSGVLTLNKPTLPGSKVEHALIRFPLLAGDSDERDRLILQFRRRGIWATKSIFHVSSSNRKNSSIASELEETMLLLPTSVKFKKKDIKV
jgi:dTDP-4-amino-4,6-dideoxygalactose transaminase